MSTETTNYNLKKPDAEDFYNVDDFNGNADIIDQTMHELSEGLAKKLDSTDFENAKKKTDIDGLLKGDGDKLSAAVPGTDYLTPEQGEAASAKTADTLGTSSLGDAITPIYLADGVPKPTIPITRKNMLRNWDFARPLNRREQATYEGMIPSIDGWLNTTPSSKTVIQYGNIAFINTGGIETFAGIGQDLEWKPWYEDIVTFTVFINTVRGMDTGDWYIEFMYYSTSDGLERFIGAKEFEPTNRLLSTTVSIPSDFDRSRSFRAQIVNHKVQEGEATIELIAAKVELNEEQTLCHLVNGQWAMNEWSSTEEEKAKCWINDLTTIDFVNGAIANRVAPWGCILEPDITYHFNLCYGSIPFWEEVKMTGTSKEVSIGGIISNFRDNIDAKVFENRPDFQIAVMFYNNVTDEATFTFSKEVKYTINNSSSFTVGTSFSLGQYGKAIVVVR